MGYPFFISNDNYRIGSAIRKLRKQAGLSQAKLAQGICNRTTIVHLEAGYSKAPSIFLLNQICNRLSITLDDFFLIVNGKNLDQLWLIKNEIEALLKANEYEKAYLLTKKHFNSSFNPIDLQYFGLIEGHYFYNCKKYVIAKNKYFNALILTSSSIKEEVYTLNEMRLIKSIIYCNWKIDGNLNTPETLNYVKILNTSIYNYPTHNDYKIVISLMLSTLRFYLSLKLYNDCFILADNIMKLSHKYLCYDYLGDLWLLLGNIYEIVNDDLKSKEYYNKSHVFFELLNEDYTFIESMQCSFYHNKMY